MNYTFEKKRDHVLVTRRDGLAVASFSFAEWGGPKGAWDAAKSYSPDPQIGDRTLSEWREFACRDDCLERMVPSDLRQILGSIG